MFSSLEDLIQAAMLRLAKEFKYEKGAIRLKTDWRPLA